MTIYINAQQLRFAWWFVLVYCSGVILLENDTYIMEPLLARQDDNQVCCIRLRGSVRTDDVLSWEHYVYIIHVESQCTLVLCVAFLLQTVWPHVVYKAVHEHDSACGMLFVSFIYEFGGVFNVSCIRCSLNAASIYNYQVLCVWSPQWRHVRRTSFSGVEEDRWQPYQESHKAEFLRRMKIKFSFVGYI